MSTRINQKEYKELKHSFTKVYKLVNVSKNVSFNIYFSVLTEFSSSFYKMYKYVYVMNKEDQPITVTISNDTPTTFYLTKRKNFQKEVFKTTINYFCRNFFI